LKRARSFRPEQQQAQDAAGELHPGAELEAVQIALQRRRRRFDHAAGGIAYTVGAVLLVRDIGRWIDPVWHGFVLAGKAAQFAAVVVFCPTPMV
jgi:hypothetical protein